MTEIPDLSLLSDKALFKEHSFIGGTWCSATSGKVLNITMPASNTILGSIPDCGEIDTFKAIEVAEEAFHSWKNISFDQRASMLEKWAGLMDDHENDLAILLSLEQGKPLVEAKGEIAYGTSFIKWFAQEARRVGGSVIPAPGTDRRIVTLKEPVGVSAIITPWNFPNAMITRKVGPALAAGCSVVIKPSELTPYSALALGVLAERAGIPAGVINIVTGMPTAIGNALTSSPIVRKLSFTGSTRVGSLLMAQSAPTVKRLSLELGGNAPFIVFNDADIDKAVESAMESKFRNGGQTCVCANRILVQSGIYEEFAKKLVTKVIALKVGPGLEEHCDIGPMINKDAIDKISVHIKDAIDKGAQVLGKAPIPNGELYTSPTILGECNTSMLVANEETFGPVAPLFRFETEEEAISIANDTPYGLAAYFFTDNVHRAWRISEALEFGMVGLNTGSVSTTISPFGGIKQSGLGREGSSVGIDEYLEIKTFHMGGF